MARQDGLRVVARGGPAPSRRTLTRTVAIVVALVVGGLIGRASAPDRGGQTTTAPVVPAPPVVAGPGPSRARAGVPVGYARSREGAAAALLNYSVVLSRLLLEEPATRDRALAVLGTARFAAGMRGQLTRARAAADRGPLATTLDGQATAVYRGGPLGYRLSSYSAERAVVETWAFGLIATSDGVGPSMSFQSATSTLIWQDGDWKLERSESRPGPTPTLTGEESVTGRAFVDGVGAMRELRYAP